MFISMYGQYQDRMVEDIANSPVGLGTFPSTWPWREPEDIAGDRIFGISSNVAPRHCRNCTPASYIGCYIGNMKS